MHHTTVAYVCASDPSSIDYLVRYYYGCVRRSIRMSCEDKLPLITNVALILRCRPMLGALMDSFGRKWVHLSALFTAHTLIFRWSQLAHYGSTVSTVSACVCFIRDVIYKDILRFSMRCVRFGNELTHKKGIAKLTKIVEKPIVLHLCDRWALLKGLFLGWFSLFNVP